MKPPMYFSMRIGRHIPNIVPLRTSPTTPRTGTDHAHRRGDPLPSLARGMRPKGDHHTAAPHCCLRPISSQHQAQPAIYAYSGHSGRWHRGPAGGKFEGTSGCIEANRTLHAPSGRHLRASGERGRHFTRDADPNTPAGKYMRRDSQGACVWSGTEPWNEPHSGWLAGSYASQRQTPAEWAPCPLGIAHPSIVGCVDEDTHPQCESKKVGRTTNEVRDGAARLTLRRSDYLYRAPVDLAERNTHHHSPIHRHTAFVVRAHGWGFTHG